MTHANSFAPFARCVISGLIVGACLAGVLPAHADEALPKFVREKTILTVEPGKWTGPRLKDGQPDVQGHWSNTIGNHSNLTKPGRDAASRITDPPDGQVPFQPWAKEKAADFGAHLTDPSRPEYIEPLARCAPAGPSKSFMWHGFEIRQFPGYVVFLFDSGTRVVHLDGKPHLPQKVKLWNGDSRGHWEGNTLIVDVQNNNGKARFGRSGEFFSENAKISERFVFDGKQQSFLYHATYDDPTVFTRPFTVTVPVRRVENFAHDNWNNILFPAKHAGKEKILERYEQICTENNGGHGNGGVR